MCQMNSYTGFSPFPQDQIPGLFQGIIRAKMTIFQGRDSRHKTPLIYGQFYLNQARQFEAFSRNLKKD